MKKNLAIGLFLILLVFTCQAQEKYYKQNLEKASTEDLNFYLEKAQKLKKAGSIVSFVGSTTILMGLVIGGHSESTAYLGFFMSMAGASIIVTGVLIRATGSKRIKIINHIKNTAFNDIKMDLAPSCNYNYTTQNYQPGITLRIRF